MNDGARRRPGARGRGTRVAGGLGLVLAALACAPDVPAECGLAGIPFFLSVAFENDDRAFYGLSYSGEADVVLAETFPDGVAARIRLRFVEGGREAGVSYVLPHGWVVPVAAGERGEATAAQRANGSLRFEFRTGNGALRGVVSWGSHSEELVRTCPGRDDVCGVERTGSTTLYVGSERVPVVLWPGQIAGVVSGGVPYRVVLARASTIELNGTCADVPESDVAYAILDNREFSQEYCVDDFDCALTDACVAATHTCVPRTAAGVDAAQAVGAKAVGLDAPLGRVERSRLPSGWGGP